MSNEIPKSDRWKESEVMKLISLYKVYALKGRFDGTVRDSEVYREIAEKLAKKSIVVKSPIQIRCKIKALKRKYRVTRDELNREGPGFKHTFRYYDEMHSILGSSKNFAFNNCDIKIEEDLDFNVSLDGEECSLQMDYEVADDNYLMSPGGEGSLERHLPEQFSTSKLPDPSTSKLKELSTSKLKEHSILKLPDPSTSKLKELNTSKLQDPSTSKLKELSTLKLSDPSTTQTQCFTSTTPAREKDEGHGKKRTHPNEDALREILKDTTDRILQFQEAAEKVAEAKREAFRKKVIQQNQEIIDLLKSILAKK